MPRKTNANNPADWLLICEQDIAFIRTSLGDDLAYVPVRAKMAEVLEKLMKAELIRRGWKLIKTHDLQRLADELSLRDASLEAEIRPVCVALSEAYLTSRYPGFDLDDPDWPALRTQLDALTALATTIRSRLANPP